MFRKSRVVAVPALLIALFVASAGDSAFARGGHGRGGGRGGRSHSMSRHRGGGSKQSSRMRSSGRRSTGQMYAHNQQHNKQSNKNYNASYNKNKNKNKNNNKHHHRHHHHHHKGDGFGDDGGDDDGDDDGDGGADGVPSALDPVVVPARVSILNPAGTGGTVNYTLGSDQYSIAAGESRAHDDGTQLIVFDRGKSFGQSTYTLQPGSYRFVMTATGWDLRTVTDQVAAVEPTNPE
jgi:hypothetical protein